MRRLARIPRRLAGMARPAMRVVAPPASGVVVEHDVAVALRDGVRARVNVFRPDGPDPVPVILSAHPYGKDHLPRPGRATAQARMLPQSVPYEVSAWTSWEAPDPAVWVARGYAVVNADLRGWGRSDGVGDLLSGQEAEDCHDLVEWCAAQAWSTGRVAMCGVSYLAITQWAAAVTRPPHLAAIIPWEGFTDAYRDLLYPGGVREDGFTGLWTTMLRRERRSPVTIRDEQRARPLRDAWYAARTPDLARIDVPALVCASFSDHCLHSGGSFRGWAGIGSADRWLHTHRGPKWSTYYAGEAVEVQDRFLRRFLKGETAAMEGVPRVRVEVREDAATITRVRAEDAWPPAGTRLVPRYLDLQHNLLPAVAPPRSGARPFVMRGGRVRLLWTVEEDTELIGPMRLRVWVEARGADDVPLVVAVRKLRDGREVGFEGSYGYTGAPVAVGWLRASHRALDEAASTGWVPVHPHDRREPLAPGQVVPLEVAIMPSATLFRAGEALALDLTAEWPEPRDPLTGGFPARYERPPRGVCVLHAGGRRDSALWVPVAPG